VAKEIEGEWYLVDGEAVFWDGTKNRRFKWKADPGLYELQGVWYFWNGSNWKKASSRQTNQIEPADDVKRIRPSVVLRFFGTALVVLLVFVLLGFGWKSFTNTPSIEVPAKAPTASELVTRGCQDLVSLSLADNFSAAAEIDEKYRMLAVSANSYRLTKLILDSDTFKSNPDRDFGQQLLQKLFADLAVIESFCQSG
jgi:hypothetical protein